MWMIVRVFMECTNCAVPMVASIRKREDRSYISSRCFCEVQRAQSHRVTPVRVVLVSSLFMVHSQPPCCASPWSERRLLPIFLRHGRSPL